MTAKEAFATALDELGFTMDAENPVQPTLPKGGEKPIGNNGTGNGSQGGSQDLMTRLAKHREEGKCTAEPGECPLEKQLKKQLEQEKGLSPEEAAKQAKAIHDGTDGSSYGKVDGQLEKPVTVDIGGHDISAMTEKGKEAAEVIKESLEHPKTEEEKRVAEEVAKELAGEAATNGMVQPGEIPPEEAKKVLGDLPKEAAAANSPQQAVDPMAGANAAAEEMRSPAGQLAALRSQWDNDVKAWHDKWSQAGAGAENTAAKQKELSKIDGRYWKGVDQVDPFHTLDGNEETVEAHMLHCKAKDPKAENCPFLRRKKSEGETIPEGKKPEDQNAKAQAAQPNNGGEQPAPENGGNAQPEVANAQPNGGSAPQAEAQNATPPPQPNNGASSQQSQQATGGTTLNANTVPKPSGEVKEVKANGKTYVDVSELGFWKGMAESFKAGWNGKEIITAWDKLRGRAPQDKSEAAKNVTSGIETALRGNLMRSVVDAHPELNPMAKMEFEAIIAEYNEAKNAIQRTRAIQKFNEAAKEYGLFDDAGDNAAAASSDPETISRMEAKYSGTTPKTDIYEEVADSERDTSFMDEKKKQIENHLAARGINAHIVNSTNGSSVVQFDIQRDENGTGDQLVKALKAMQDDLGVTINYQPDRTSGRERMGTITINNPNVRDASLRRLLEDSDATAEAKKMMAPMLWGETAEGKPVWIDMMDHGFMGGDSNSGKSERVRSALAGTFHVKTPNQFQVLVNAHKNAPDYSHLDGDPHTMKVGSTVQDVAKNLKFAEAEVNRRDKLFREANVQNLKDYNKKMVENGTPEKCLPQMLVITDEVTDLLSQRKDLANQIRSIVTNGRKFGVAHLGITQDMRATNVPRDLKGAQRLGVQSSLDTADKMIFDEKAPELRSLERRGGIMAKVNGKVVRLRGTFAGKENLKRLHDYNVSTYKPGAATEEAEPPQPQPQQPQAQEKAREQETHAESGTETAATPNEETSANTEVPSEPGSPSSNPNDEEEMTPESAQETLKRLMSKASSTQQSEESNKAEQPKNEAAPQQEQQNVEQPQEQKAVEPPKPEPTSADIANSPEARKTRARTALDKKMKAAQKQFDKDGDEGAFQKATKAAKEEYDQLIKDIDDGLSFDDIAKREADKKAKQAEADAKLAATVVKELHGKPVAGATPKKNRGNPDAAHKVTKSVDLVRIAKLLPDGWTTELDADDDGNPIKDGMDRVVVRHPTNGSYGWINLKTNKFIPGVVTTHEKYKGANSDEAKAALKKRNEAEGDAEWSKANKEYNNIAYGHDEAIPDLYVVDEAISLAIAEG